MEEFDSSFHTADERRKGAPIMDDALYTVEETFDIYNWMVCGGVKKEVARQILPLCTMTKFYWTVNLRSLMNFLSNRMAAGAQTDIRENANEIYKFFEQEYPNIAKVWRERDEAVRKFFKKWRTK